MPTRFHMLSQGLHFLLSVIQPSISVITLQHHLVSNGLNNDLIGPSGAQNKADQRAYTQPLINRD